MDTELKDCSTCQHLKGRKSIDDVPKDCYPCVHHYSRMNFYPNWQAIQAATPVTTEEEDEWKAMTDNVNSPKHYTQGGIETIDFIEAKLGKEGTSAYCMGNVIKYVTRWKDKNGREDLEKAHWYLTYAINLIEK